ncbi:hypothetical protein Tco_1151425, partial [Tanacetum coccineum]
PQWELFRIYEPVYRKLVREFFAMYEFGAATYRPDPRAAGIQFRLGRELRSLSLVDFCWQIGLYSEIQGRELNMALAFKNGLKVRNEAMIFWDFDPTCDLSLEYWALRPDHQKKSLVSSEILMELVSGQCRWVRTRGAQQQHEQEEEEEENENGDGSFGDDRRSGWMYEHMVLQMQHLSTRDHLEPHVYIDPFPGREADYPPFGYTRHMPHGYVYRYDTALDGSS